MIPMVMWSSSVALTGKRPESPTLADGSSTSDDMLRAYFGGAGLGAGRRVSQTIGTMSAVASARALKASR